MMGRFKMWLCVGIFLSSLLVINSDAACSSGSCQNGGTCVSNKCSCTSGYTGNQCEVDIDECTQHRGICQNGGTCYNIHGSYTCSCTAVYTGKNCSINIDDCKTSDGSPACENNGTCVDGLGRYSCSCPDEYIGQRCQYQDECKVNKTRCGTGICDKDLNGSAICRCDRTGYNGTSCENDIDECSLGASPCDTDTSTCVNTPGSYECKCKDGWVKEGTNQCTKFMNSCASNPCVNGQCSTHLNAYKCHCYDGYTGDRCQTMINECDSNPCLNGGQCVDGHQGYKCKCDTGFKGVNCEIKVNHCLSRPCQNNATCTTVGNTFQCNCTVGYTGLNCSVNVDDCLSASCQNNATCEDGINEYKCICGLGFTGVFCEHDVNECLTSPCQNGGNCTNKNGTYICECPSGFTGKNCETNVDDCASVTCLNDGKCKDLLNNFTCDCHPGFRGEYCKENIDECIPQPCKNGGTCIDGIAGYICRCPQNWIGENCTIRNDSCRMHFCGNGATCVSNGSSYYNCKCAPGFTGKYCQKEIDECQQLTPCRHGACTDRVNDYHCTCQPGWTGKNCDQNIDYCKQKYCYNNGTCVNHKLKAECNCPKGFTGIYCEYLDNLCQPNPCQNGATCVNEIGDYRCYCKFGYEGKNCEKQINGCEPNLCQNNATCHPEGAGYFNCKCPDGSNYTGAFCNIKNWLCADTNKCLNGGRCVDRGTYSTCTCKSGFTGDICETNIDDCASGPCKYGAKCVDGINNYTCECFPGFEGRNCESEIKECESNPCLNGKCVDLINEYACMCDVGWVGKNCDENPNDCTKDICFNGGVCSDKLKDFTCTCPKGFRGKRCEENIDECSSNPCWAEGTERCIDLVNDYYCKCKPGYAKRACSFDINECLSNPCLNNGKCKNEIGRYVCECPYGYSGVKCEKSVRSCVDKPCLNDGKCTEVGSRYNCICKKGVFGRHCEFNQDDCTPKSCTNAAKCIDGYGDYTCDGCKPGYSGDKCQHMNQCVLKCKNGGILDEDSCSCQCEDTGFSGRTCEDKQLSCPHSECPKEFNVNADCSDKCNTEKCNFTAGSCSLGISPWRDCKVKNCSKLFKNNGTCDAACDNANCLFDGRDCDEPVASCRDVDRCSKSLLEKTCDIACDTIGCAYSGLNCDDSPPKLLPGTVVLYLRVDLDTFEKMKGEFLLQLSAILRTVCSVNLKNGVEDISSVVVARKKRSVFRFKRDVERGTKVGLQIDNRKCTRNCFESNQQVANYMAGMKTKGTSLPGDPFRIETEDDKPSESEPSFNPLFIAILCVAIPLIVVGVLVGGKRVFAKLWLPEGFPTRHIRGSQRRDPVGEDSADKSSVSKSSSSEEIADEAYQQQYSGARPAKRFKLIDSDGPMRIANPKDNRQWTAIHKEVANVNNRTVSSLSVLTPPQEGQECAQQSGVNAVGPGGITPMMLAVSRGNYLDGAYEDENSDDSGAQIVGELIQFGGALESKSDDSKETPLHFAARHARADAAKRLLDAGAEANARDRTGRTPLHLAVTADAQGVFELLLRHRTTELDAQSDDGTTPLIYAARFMVDDMVDALIKAGAKVNLTDKQGKTALHWSASVDNEKATALLLKNNAKKDAQDSKGQTPLFLASKEGSASVVKMLLSSFANRKLADNMDQSPLDIAKQREHADIVKLLSDWSIGCKSPTAAPAPTSPHEDMSPLAARTLSPPDVRPKTNGSPGIAGRPDTHQKPNRKKRRKPRNDSDSQQPVQVAMLVNNHSPGNSISPRQGLSPFSNNSYGGSLSPSNSTFSPPLHHVDNTTSPLRDSDQVHGGISDADFYSFAEELGSYGNQPNDETLSPEFLNIENAVDLADFAMLFNNPNLQQTGNQDCLYANQYPPDNVILPNGVENPTRMRQRTQASPSKTWVQSPSEMTAWNSMCSNGAMKQHAPAVQMNGGYHREARNRDCQYPTPPYELSPTSNSPVNQWSSSSSRSSNSDCSTC